MADNFTYPNELWFIVVGLFLSTIFINKFNGITNFIIWLLLIWINNLNLFEWTNMTFWLFWIILTLMWLKKIFWELERKF